MGRVFVIELEGKTYKCKVCETQLAHDDDIESRNMLCRSGKAYLLKKMYNIFLGNPEEELLLAGLHVASEAFCCCCGNLVGWKYVKSDKKSRTPEEGRFVLDREKIVDIEESDEEDSDEEEIGFSPPRVYLQHFMNRSG